MIKAGDTVYLKSGGPEMTVGNIRWWSKKAVCFTWLLSKGKDYQSTYLNTRNIPVDALELSKG